jgi:hypothetical protein
MKKICAFSIADNNNLPYAKMLEKSLKYFHPDIELKIFGEEDIKQINLPEPYYRAKAFFGKQLSKDYDLVINIDADCIVVGSLDDIINSSYDVGSVYNNLLGIPDPLKRPICTLDKTNPLFYVNAGLVASKSKKFWDWWDDLNKRHFFGQYQFREQDTLNMIFYYGNLNCVNFDNSANVYGIYLNGYWPKAQLKNKDIVIPKEIVGQEKTIKILHWAGGSGMLKMNYRTKFSEKVADRIEEILK